MTSASIHKMLADEDFTSSVFICEKSKYVPSSYAVWQIPCSDLQWLIDFIQDRKQFYPSGRSSLVCIGKSREEVEIRCAILGISNVIEADDALVPTLQMKVSKR